MEFLRLSAWSHLKLNTERTFGNVYVPLYIKSSALSNGKRRAVSYLCFGAEMACRGKEKALYIDLIRRFRTVYVYVCVVYSEGDVKFVI